MRERFGVAIWAQKTERLLASRWVPLLAFLIAFAIRVGMTHHFEGLASGPMVAAGGLDVVDYEAFAWRTVSGQGYVLDDGTPTARRSPGTSMALMAPYYLFGRSFVAAHLWFCFLSAMTCAGIWWLGSAAGRPVLGGLAGIGLAVYPGHFYYSMHFFSEVPETLFLVVFITSCYIALSRGLYLWSTVAGAAFGLAVLTRPNLLLVVPAFLSLLPLWHRDLPRLLDFKRLAALAISFALLVSPWLVRNYRVIGKPTFATVVGGVTFWGANNEIVLRDANQRGRWIFSPELRDTKPPLSGSELERESLAWRYGVEFVSDHVGDMPMLIGWKIARLFAPFEPTANSSVYWTFAFSWVLLFPLVVYGVWRLALDDRLLCALVVSPLLATIMTVIPFYGSIRMRDSVAPLLVFAGAGAVDYCMRVLSRPSPTAETRSAPG